MKKIVSVLAVAALTLGAVFAADVSLGFRTGSYILDRESTTDKVGTDDKTTTEVLDLVGYRSSAKSDLILKAGNDVAGVVVDIDPSASKMSLLFDEYYAWANAGNLQVTAGNWKGRYMKRVNADAGKWESNEYERYKLGVANGTLGTKDVDNLTVVDGTQQLATALAYTFRSVVSDDDALMIKGVAAHNTTWGGFNYNDEGKPRAYLRSSPAFEVTYRNETIDVDAIFKSPKRDQIATALLFRFIGVENLDTVVGVTYGSTLGDVKHYYELGVDLRARYKITDELAVTTMHNFSLFNEGSDDNSKQLWNMVSAKYDVNDTISAQFTVHNECSLGGKSGGTSFSLGDAGGLNLELIPGVIIRPAENVSFTTGVIIGLKGYVAADSDYTDAEGKKLAIKIPFVFNISL